MSPDLHIIKARKSLRELFLAKLLQMTMKTFLEDVIKAVTQQ